MASVDLVYNDLVKDILKNGSRGANRTGIDTIGVFGRQIRFDLTEGFPILTTRKLPTKSTWVELEGFIKGKTSKNWYKKRGCHYWDYWCNPQRVPYATDKETQWSMGEEDDLGEIYGYQWRGASYEHYSACSNSIEKGRGPDQLQILVEKLVAKKDDRRLIVDAWNTLALDRMALVPCHRSFQCHIDGEYLDLQWDQRSVDTVCGLPQNIVSYATLLITLAATAGLKPRSLIGNLADTHIYVNHLEGVEEQIERKIYDAPTFEWVGFSSIWFFEHTQCSLKDYEAGERIKYSVAV
jgi:thymidylate synthase